MEILFIGPSNLEQTMVCCYKLDCKIEVEGKESETGTCRDKDDHENEGGKWREYTHYIPLSAFTF